MLAGASGRRRAARWRAATPSTISSSATSSIRSTSSRKYLQRWVDELKKRSDGRLNITIFPANEMGPVQNYVDYARTGVADITWYLSGATPGRFPLTEIIQLPYMVGSAEIGTKTLNDPEVLKLIAPEYQGLQILYLLTHQPGNLLTTEKAGAHGRRHEGAAHPLRLGDDQELSSPRSAERRSACRRAASPTPCKSIPSTAASSITAAPIRRFISAASPNTSTEMYSYVSSFGVVMNPASYAKLPPDLQKLIDDTTRPRIDEIGKLWDSADAPGKKYLIDNGDTPIKLSKDQDALFKKIGAEDTARVLKELDGRGLPASKVHAAMQAAAAEAAKTSFSFWKT